MKEMKMDRLDKISQAIETLRDLTAEQVNERLTITAYDETKKLMAERIREEAEQLINSICNVDVEEFISDKFDSLDTDSQNNILWGIAHDEME
jgi:hypothetical protein